MYTYRRFFRCWFLLLVEIPEKIMYDCKEKKCVCTVYINGWKVVRMFHQHPTSWLLFYFFSFLLRFFFFFSFSFKLFMIFLWFDGWYERKFLIAKFNSAKKNQFLLRSDPLSKATIFEIAKNYKVQSLYYRPNQFLFVCWLFMLIQFL